MTKFDIIGKIKEVFQNNINDSDSYFNKTKDTLKDFENCIQNHPKTIAGLGSACIIAMASLGYDVNKKESAISLDVYNQEKSSQFGNKKEFMTNEFLRVPMDAAKIRNIANNSIHPEFNNNTHEQIKRLSENEGMMFNNPFWKNNIVTVYNKPNQSSQYHHDVFTNTAIDTSIHRLDMDYIQIDKIRKSMGVPENKQYLVENYTFYHEAAHASYVQSIPYAGTTTNRIDNELMSDVSSLLYIGHQNKQDFDYLIDKTIDYRMSNLAYGNEMTSFMHSTAYGLIELKKAIEKDPSLLNMEPENMPQFSDMFVKELKSINLSQHHQNSLSGFKYPSADTISNDIQQNNKEDYYKAITFYQLYRGGENNRYNRVELPKVKDWFNDPASIQMLSEDISKTLRTDLRYDTLSKAVLENSGNDPSLAVKKMKEMVDNKPALKNDFIQAIAKGNLIYLDELKVDVAPVRKLEEDAQLEKLRLEQQIQNTNKRKVNLQKPNMNNNNS